MVDVLGNKVEVGDKVLFIPNHYKELLIGTNSQNQVVILKQVTNL